MIDYWVLGVVMILTIAALFFIDHVFDGFFEWLFCKAGLQSGNGPLVVGSRSQGKKIILSLENKGKYAMKLAAVEGIDGNQKKCYPVPYLEKDAFFTGDEKRERFKQFAGMKLKPGKESTVILDQDELAALGCLTLGILDQRGNKWPVCGFEPDEGN